MQRLASWLAGLAIVLVLGAASLSGPAWGQGGGKGMVAEADLARLIEESVKNIQDGVKSSGNFNLKGKAIEHEAYAVLIFAQAAAREGGDLGKKAAALTNAAQQLAEAAKKKNLDEAKKHAATLAGFKSLKAEGGKGEADLNKIPIEDLMELVGAADKELRKQSRFTAAQWGMKGAPESAQMYSNRMVALTLGMEAHAMDGKKGATKAMWNEAVEGVRSATREMAAAAKAKKQADFKAAFKKMDAACTKCHDKFRDVE